MLIYSRNLKFEDDPDYQHLRNLVKQACEKNGIVDDGLYDWLRTGYKTNKGNVIQHIGAKKSGTCILL